jgi:hypothetical protein
LHHRPPIQQSSREHSHPDSARIHIEGSFCSQAPARRPHHAGNRPTASARPPSATTAQSANHRHPRRTKVLPKLWVELSQVCPSTARVPGSPVGPLAHRLRRRRICTPQPTQAANHQGDGSRRKDYAHLARMLTRAEGRVSTWLHLEDPGARHASAEPYAEGQQQPLVARTSPRITTDVHRGCWHTLESNCSPDKHRRRL